VASLTATEVAEQIIALTSSDAKKAVVAAQLARKSLGKIEEQYSAQIEKLWDDANAKALQLLTLIKQNNPNKTVDEIFARKDVQAVLKKPFDDAASKSEAIIREAWGKAEADTVQKVKGEFKLGGHDWKGHELDDSVLDSIVGDLHANAGAMRDRYHDALNEGGISKVEGVARDSRRRAKYSLIVAIWEAANETRDSAFAFAGLNKMWVAVLDDKTCSHCKFLHGKVINPGEQFIKVPKGIKPLKVYNGVLYGPPRHPNCRCILVATTLKKSK
jgi:hypothetical protein